MSILERYLDRWHNGQNLSTADYVALTALLVRARTNERERAVRAETERDRWLELCGRELGRAQDAEAKLDKVREALPSEQEWERIWPLAEQSARQRHREHAEPFDECPRTICVYNRTTLRLIQHIIDKQRAALAASEPQAGQEAEPWRCEEPVEPRNAFNMSGQTVTATGAPSDPADGGALAVEEHADALCQLRDEEVGERIPSDVLDAVDEALCRVNTTRAAAALAALRSARRGDQDG